MTDENDPAFPETSEGNFFPGLTIREYAAIKIMAGFAADPSTANTDCDALAGTAVLWADDLIAALNKETP